MSDKKPKAAWDDEPTPLCEKERWQPDDDKARSAKDGCIEVVDFDVARDLERRLRHALKLANSLRIDVMHVDGKREQLDPELVEQRLSAVEEVLTL